MYEPRYTRYHNTFSDSEIPTLNFVEVIHTMKNVVWMCILLTVCLNPVLAETSSKITKAKIMQKEAWNQLRAGEVSIAVRKSKKSMKLFRKAGDLEGEASSLYLRAHISRKKKKFLEAEKDLTRSEKLYRRIMSKSNQEMNKAELNNLRRKYGNVLYSLVRANMLSRKYDIARKNNNRRLKLYDQSNNIQGRLSVIKKWVK